MPQHIVADLPPYHWYRFPRTLVQAYQKDADQLHLEPIPDPVADQHNRIGAWIGAVTALSMLAAAWLTH